MDLVMFLVTFFLGYLGIHRFLKGHIISGIIWLFTGGLFGIGWLIDVIWTLLDKPLIFQE